MLSSTRLEHTEFWPGNTDCVCELLVVAPTDLQLSSRPSWVRALTGQPWRTWYLLISQIIASDQLTLPYVRLCYVRLVFIYLFIYFRMLRSVCFWTTSLSMSRGAATFSVWDLSHLNNQGQDHNSQGCHFIINPSPALEKNQRHLLDQGQGHSQHRHVHVMFLIVMLIFHLIAEYRFLLMYYEYVH